MATALNFTKSNGVWVAQFTSGGNTIIEIEREQAGLVSVMANISGMRAVPIAQYDNGYTADAILRINVPAGIEVTVKSATEVTTAQIQVEGA